MVTLPGLFARKVPCPVAASTWSFELDHEQAALSPDGPPCAVKEILSWTWVIDDAGKIERVVSLFVAFPRFAIDG